MPVVTKDLGAQALLATLAEETPNGRFRRTIRISVPTGGKAISAKATDGTVLDISFNQNLLDLTDPGTPEQARITDMGDGIRLKLPRARMVHRIRLKNALSNDRIEVFRLDGNVVSDRPVASDRHRSYGANLNAEDTDFKVRWHRNEQVRDLDPNDVDKVQVNYMPLNMRLAYEIVGDPEGEQPLAPLLDDDGQPFRLWPRRHRYGKIFGEALTAQIARFADKLVSGDTRPDSEKLQDPLPLPDPLKIDLVIEADVPCRAEVKALSLDLDLEAPALAEKAVLRFPGGRIQRQEVSLNVPPSSQIMAAPITLSRAPKPNQAQQPAGPGSSSAPGADGIRVEPAASLASRSKLDAALLADGVHLWLSAPDDQAEALIRLRENEADVPGAILAESPPLTIEGPAPTPYRAMLPPTALPSGEVWVELAVTRGAAVAMLTGMTGSNLATGTGGSFQIHPQKDLRLAAAFLTSPTGAPDLGGQLSLDLGGQTVPLPTPTANGKQIDLDLAAALNGVGGGRVALAITTARAELITLRPPHLTYRHREPAQ